MTGAAAPTSDGVRTAEMIAAACLATDLGMEFPFEHGLQGTLMAMRLADLLDVDPQTESEVYYSSLLMYSGCTTEADVAIRIFGGSRTTNLTPAQFGSRAESAAAALRSLPSAGASRGRRLYEMASRAVPAARFLRPHFAALCEVAEMMADRLGLPKRLQKGFRYLTERWDGNGALGRAVGDELPLSIRIVHVARDAAYQRLIGGNDHAVEVIRRRSGHAFDPDVAARFLEAPAEVMAAADMDGSGWEATLAREPRPWVTLEADRVERALGAIGDFADLVAPHLSGHSAGVAQLASAAGRTCGLDPEEVRVVRRAALVHDIGRVGVHPRIWQKPAPLTVGEWEEVRLHPYHTERVLLPSAFLAPLADVACAHHERPDGTGYHRRLQASSLTPGARLLAAADAFHAMREPRPHRPALSAADAAEELRREATAGRQDPEMVAVVVESAGQPRPPVERPGGLTEREAQVVGLLSRGLQTKQVARRLDISIKTADRHVQNAYRKIGVSTRAGATLFAMEHGLVPGRPSPPPAQPRASH